VPGKLPLDGRADGREVDARPQALDQPGDDQLDRGAQQGRIGFGYGTFFQKGQQMGTGQCPVKRYNQQLRDLIIAGRATPSLLVSHEPSPDEAPGAYDKFDKRTDGYTNVLLHP
jgi:glutathione-independent formaldehyde dehydrogenase